GRTAAPAMAVSQVDRLTNPCGVPAWNSPVAAQPPPSAPAMPIRQIMSKPCDLLPGIAIWASRPALRPRTIHAMMPITDSLVSDQVRPAVAGHAGWAAGGGRRILPRVLTVLWPWRLAGIRSGYDEKNPGPAATTANIGDCSRLGPELHFSQYTFSASTHRAFRGQLTCPGPRSGGGMWADGAED